MAWAAAYLVHRDVSLHRRDQELRVRGLARRAEVLSSREAVVGRYPQPGWSEVLIEGSASRRAELRSFRPIGARIEMLCAPAGEPCDSREDIEARLAMWPLAPGIALILLAPVALLVAWWAEGLEAHEKEGALRR